MTSDGWIYDKEAVLKYILDKKEEYRKQLKVYESQTSQEFKTLAAEAEKDREKKRKAFEKSEQSILSTAKPSAASGGPSTSAAAAGSSSASTSHAKVGTSKGLPSFWVPNLTPQVCPCFFCTRLWAAIAIDSLISLPFRPLRPRSSGQRRKSFALCPENPLR